MLNCRQAFSYTIGLVFNVLIANGYFLLLHKADL